MVEVEMLNSVDINSQNRVNCETEVPRTLDDVLNDYESSLHSALFGNSDDEEGDFDIQCARETLVDEGLSLVKTSKDCDRILSKLNITKNESLMDKVWEKQDSLLFTEIIKEFDTRHKSILDGNLPCGDDEILEEIRCDRLRMAYLTEALKLANTQEECLEILGRTLDRHTCIRQLVNEKMASLPIKVRK